MYPIKNQDALKKKFSKTIKLVSDQKNLEMTMTNYHNSIQYIFLCLWPEVKKLTKKILKVYNPGQKRLNKN